MISIDPAQANPFGLGSVASGGDTLSLTVALDDLAAPADLYLGIGVDSGIFLLAADNSIQPLTSGLIKWKANTTGGFNVQILPDIDMSDYPGTYTFYLLMAPAGRMDAFRLWMTQLVVEGEDPANPPDEIMEQEIKQNIDLIFGITSMFSGGLTELLEIFSDTNVVTISPAELSLETLMSGDPITITADFGSGYTMQSGSVMSGSAQIVISIEVSLTGIGAEITGTFNVMKDGAPFAIGQISGTLMLTPGSGDSYNISGQIVISNLNVSGQQLSGTIQISGTLDELNLSSLTESTGSVRLTFINFTVGAYTINSGYIDIVIGQNISITTNLQTNSGPVTLDLVLTITEQGMVLNTTAPGAAGAYTVSIDDVTLDQSICPNYPASGTISFTNNSGTTGVVTFTGACDGTYDYTEI